MNMENRVRYVMVTHFEKRWDKIKRTISKRMLRNPDLDMKNINRENTDDFCES